MKAIISLLAVAALSCGCVSVGSSVPHDDSVAVVPRDQGPALCRDGTVPPCNPRD